MSGNSRGVASAVIIRWALLTAVLVIGTWWIAGGSAARWLTALRVLDDLRRPGADSWLQRGTPAPSMDRSRLESRGASFIADVYHPATGDSPVPMLLVPGAVEQGKDDPRVAPFARMLARAGFTAVIPDIPSMRRVRVHPDQVEGIAAAPRSCARTGTWLQGGGRASSESRTRAGSRCSWRWTPGAPLTFLTWRPSGRTRTSTPPSASLQPDACSRKVPYAKSWTSDPWGFLTRDVPEAAALAGWWTALLRERNR